MSDKGISIVVCCYNSAKRLPITLQHLIQQKQDLLFSWEIIIVDNASSDNTAEIASQWLNNYTCQTSFKIVYEPMPGLNYARERGIGAANYEYILFVDDDNWLDENYIKYTYQIMESDSSIGALGGQSIAVCENNPPAWFEPLKASYAVGQQAAMSCDVTKRGYLWGAGLVIRKSVWQQVQQIGFKTMLSDRKGKSISSGGDGEICSVIRLLGYTLYYDDRLQFKHFITKERLSWPYYRKLLRSFGQARVYLDLYDYLLQKQARQRVLPSHKLWKYHWNKDIKTFVENKKNIIDFFFSKKEGLFNIIGTEMMYGRICELWKIRSTYDQLLKQSEKTFEHFLTSNINTTVK